MQTKGMSEQVADVRSRFAWMLFKVDVMPAMIPWFREPVGMVAVVDAAENYKQFNIKKGTVSERSLNTEAI